MSVSFFSRSLLAVAIGGAFLGSALHAEEGMWTFDNPPVKQLQDNTTSRRRRRGWTTSACPACG